MSNPFRPDGAKIYEFPRKARTVAVHPRPEGGGEVFRFRRPQTIDIGGWYHEAAIQDERTHKP